MNQDKKPITKEQFKAFLTEMELKTGKSQLEIAREIHYLVMQRQKQNDKQN